MAKSFNLLLENGDVLLLENGDALLVESIDGRILGVPSLGLESAGTATVSREALAAPTINQETSGVASIGREVLLDTVTISLEVSATPELLP